MKCSEPQGNDVVYDNVTAHQIMVTLSGACDYCGGTK